MAAAVGLVHAAFSVYWGLGGTWLLTTLGADLVASFARMLWLIVIVGVVKASAAVAPWWLAHQGWPMPRLTRGVTWAGALVLLGWGGVGAVSANLVLAGVVEPDGGYDRDGMIGHAWLWDPLFVLWGLALVVGLRRSRGGRCAPREVT